MGLSLHCIASLLLLYRTVCTSRSVCNQVARWLGRKNMRVHIAVSSMLQSGARSSVSASVSVSATRSVDPTRDITWLSISLQERGPAHDITWLSISLQERGPARDITWLSISIQGR